MKIEYLENENLVLLTTTEDLTSDSIKYLIQKSVAFRNEHNCNHILFDHRGCRVHAEIIEIHQIAKNIKDFGFTFSHAAAVVYNVDSKNYQFADTVVHNWAAHAIQFFDDFEEAKNWLVNR